MVAVPIAIGMVDALVSNTSELTLVSVRSDSYRSDSYRIGVNLRAHINNKMLIKNKT